MNRCCFIVPYFGNFPQVFPLFLKSVNYNPDYDWIIFTDNEMNYPISSNIKVENVSFDYIKELIQSRFSFPIVLDSPYKLCDYKCAYGYIFEEYLSGYDFWGYCDIDLIFGKISDFLTPTHLKQYDKIGHLGHFSLYRNNEKMRMLFSIGDFYKTVFTSSRVYVFDEWNEGSINHIAMENGVSLCMLNTWSDIYPFYSYLSTVLYSFSKDGKMKFVPDGKVHLFIWKSGIISDIVCEGGKTFNNPRMYVHFQKRKFDIEECCYYADNAFICGPNTIRKITKNNSYLEIARSRLLKLFNIKLVQKKSKEIMYLFKSNLSVIIKGEKQ